MPPATVISPLSEFLEHMQAGSRGMISSALRKRLYSHGVLLSLPKLSQRPFGYLPLCWTLKTEMSQTHPELQALPRKKIRHLAGINIIQA